MVASGTYFTAKCGLPLDHLPEMKYKFGPVACVGDLGGFLRFFGNYSGPSVQRYTMYCSLIPHVVSQTRPNQPQRGLFSVSRMCVILKVIGAGVGCNWVWLARLISHAALSFRVYCAKFALIVASFPARPAQLSVAFP